MSPEIFLNEKQKEIDNPLINWGVGYTATVMMEFAIEYHKKELSKLHQPTVISAVCEHTKGSCKIVDKKHTMKCDDCGEIIWQTDL